MQIIGLILVLINVGTIVAPIAGMAIVYQDHIDELGYSSRTNTNIKQHRCCWTRDYYPRQKLWV